MIEVVLKSATNYTNFHELKSRIRVNADNRCLVFIVCRRRVQVATQSALRSDCPPCQRTTGLLVYGQAVLTLAQAAFEVGQLPALRLEMLQQMADHLFSGQLIQRPAPQQFVHRVG